MRPLRRPLQGFFRLIALALLQLSLQSATAQTRLEGVVLDAETRSPLSGAHVVAVETGAGAVTNPEGRFGLVLPQLPAELRIRHIGYETRRVRVESAAEIVIELTPAVVELDEIVVTGETFAEQLMRNVIAEKQRWSSRLRSYEAEGFSRVLLERDSIIMHVSEVTFDHYWKREHGSRAGVTNYSETAEWYDELPLPPAAHVVNLYDDVVDIQGLSFVGPTHPDALERYVFRLAGRRKLDDRLVYDLYVSPRDERLATFVGRVSVLDSVFAMVEAELRPARHVVFPEPLHSWRAVYAQQFTRVDGPWLPVGLQVDGTVAIAVDAKRRRVFDVRRRAQLSRYRINSELPQAPFDMNKRVIVDEQTVLNDPLFIYGRVLMPLTARETEALERLRNGPSTLREALPPSERAGRLAAFLEGSAESPRLSWPTIMGYEFQFRYNRVDGLLSKYRTRSGYLAAISARMAAGSSNRTQPRALTRSYPTRVRRGGLCGIRLTISARLTRETHRSVDREVGTSWPFGESFRANPEIREGTLGSAAVTAQWIGERPRIQSSLRHLEATVQYEPAGADFGFTRYGIDAEVYVPTLLRRRPLPASLRLRFTGGAATGSLPPQLLAALDGSLSIADAVHVGRIGTFRTLHSRPLAGRRHAAVFWEHDFTTRPLEWGPLWPLAHRGTSLSLFGGHGRTWLGEAANAGTVRDRSLHELGLSLTHLWGTPFRIDIASRLGERGLSIGFGASLRIR